MKTSKLILLNLICLCASLCISAGATDISGDIWGELSPAANPYRVVGDLRVPPCSSLLISPGCFFEFQDHYMLYVDTSASLIAIGTETDSIIFAPVDTAVGWFGIRLVEAGSAVLSYCRLEHASADGEQGPHYGEWANNGGVVCCINSSSTISNSRLSYNSVPAGNGGAVYCRESEITLDGNHITHNSASDGGGMAILTSEFRLSENVISNNTAYYPLGGEFGGGVYCSGSSGSIAGNAVDSNICWFFSGGLDISGGTIAILNNQIRFNGSDYMGGISISNSNVTLMNNVISNNVSYNQLYRTACAIAAYRSHLTAINNVVYGNQSTHGAALSISDGISDTIANCVFWNNSSRGDTNIYIYNSVPLFSHCDVQDGWPGEGNIDIDPLFRNPSEGDFHLQSIACGDTADSPCIDDGWPDMLDSLLDCSHGLGGPRSDMGAYGGGLYVVGIDDDAAETPDDFGLLSNYPNPFNAQTTINYALPRGGMVKLQVYDIMGRVVATLAEGNRPAGLHQIVWQAKDMPSAIYLVRFQAGEFVQSRKMTLLK